MKGRVMGIMQKCGAHYSPYIYNEEACCCHLAILQISVYSKKGEEIT